MLRLRLGLLPFLVMGLMAAGCLKNAYAPGKVTGSVTYKGKPVKAANLTFHSEDKGSYNTSVDTSGHYEITDVPAGTMKVTIETESFNPKAQAPSYGGPQGKKLYEERMAAEKQKGMGPPNAEELAARYVPIPKKYGIRESTPLTVTIQAGNQTHDFDLKDD